MPSARQNLSNSWLTLTRGEQAIGGLLAIVGQPLGDLDRATTRANMYFLLLPAYSPERDPDEHLWDALREMHLSNRIFDSLDAIEDHLVASWVHRTGHGDRAFHRRMAVGK